MRVLIALCCLYCTWGQAEQVDTLIVNAKVYTGELAPTFTGQVAIKGQRIVAVSDKPLEYQAQQVIDAKGMALVPGFIDPHTHSLFDLSRQDTANNINYTTQGVTTVFNGNDGGGPFAIAPIVEKLTAQGIGTNTGLFVGHGTVRKKVMGFAKQQASEKQLEQMKQLVKQGMEQGAFGLSSGLYYVPGNYANTEEVIALATVAAQFDGLYDTHIRSESDIAAIKETLRIGKEAGTAVHFAHLKALGKDSWGMSKQVVALIEQARKDGMQVTADQYPWRASGTRVSNAIFPKWAMADSKEKFHQRLRDPTLQQKLYKQIAKKLAWRGGAESLLLVAAPKPQWKNKTLAQVAELEGSDPIATAIDIVLQGDARVASFNMSFDDIGHFVTQPWVMTSSDGTNGHPRKYGSFPQKYQKFVVQQPLLTDVEFVHRSSGLTAKTLGIENRRAIKAGYFADLALIDFANYRANANYQQPARLSSGVIHVWVNGRQVLRHGKATDVLAGKVLVKHKS